MAKKYGIWHPFLEKKNQNSRKVNDFYAIYLKLAKPWQSLKSKMNIMFFWTHPFQGLCTLEVKMKGISVKTSFVPAAKLIQYLESLDATAH